MGFDLDKFQGADIRQREERVPVPELAAFFEDGEEPVFVVRSLGAEEYGRVQAEQRAAKADVLREIVARVQGGDRNQVIGAMRDYLEDADGRVPDDIIRRIYLIEHGLVSPRLDHDGILRLSQWTEPFYRLSNKIMALTGLGPDMGESSGSGTTPVSKPPSSSDASGATEGPSSASGDTSTSPSPT